MSRVQRLRVFVSQRLNVAVEEILEAFEKTIVKYEEEAALSREVISRQHALLCALNNPIMEASSTDVFTQQLLYSKENVSPNHQNLSQDVVSEPLRVEVKQQEEQLQDLDDVEIIEFTYNSKNAINPRNNFQTLAEPGSVVPNQDGSLAMSSDTEDSDDYSKAAAEARPASEKPQEHNRPTDGFTCRVCNRTFTARRFLFRHVRAHIRDTKQVCGLCGEQFEVVDGLKNHLQTHSKTRKRKIQVRTQSREMRIQLYDIIRNKETEKPDESSKTPLKKKRPRGRPRKDKLDQDSSGKTKKRKRKV
ncbi:zinc finger imprinted 2 [Nematolebias whitei]|uniref:zinc finger imprinted 2 n=1 Tax=Nematolebias whitei TaxID=451745 RepID=UPI001899AD04|nr:zinc finger imprinted 2 [Nematolebias whitei]